MSIRGYPFPACLPRKMIPKMNLTTVRCCYHTYLPDRMERLCHADIGIPHSAIPPPRNTQNKTEGCKTLTTKLNNTPLILPNKTLVAQRHRMPPTCGPIGRYVERPKYFATQSFFLLCCFSQHRLTVLYLLLLFWGWKIMPTPKPKVQKPKKAAH